MITTTMSGKGPAPEPHARSRPQPPLSGTAERSKKPVRHPHSSHTKGRAETSLSGAAAVTGFHALANKVASEAKTPSGTVIPPRGAKADKGPSGSKDVAAEKPSAHPAGTADSPQKPPSLSLGRIPSTDKASKTPADAKPQRPSAPSSRAVHKTPKGDTEKGPPQVKKPWDLRRVRLSASLTSKQVYRIPKGSPPLRRLLHAKSPQKPSPVVPGLSPVASQSTSGPSVSNAGSFPATPPAHRLVPPEFLAARTVPAWHIRPLNFRRTADGQSSTWRLVPPRTIAAGPWTLALNVSEGKAQANLQVSPSDWSWVATAASGLHINHVTLPPEVKNLSFAVSTFGQSGGFLSDQHTPGGQAFVPNPGRFARSAEVGAVREAYSSAGAAQGGLSAVDYRA